MMSSCGSFDFVPAKLFDSQALNKSALNELLGAASIFEIGGKALNDLPAIFTCSLAYDRSFPHVGR